MTTESRHRSVLLNHVPFAAVSEREVVAIVADSLTRGLGGTIVTPNVDILRQMHRHPELADSDALIVADGMPLVWISRVLGDPLPERVTGSSLIFSLSGAASRNGWSVFLLGGPPGMAERAAVELTSDFSPLAVVGCAAPAVRIDDIPGSAALVLEELTALRPDIVFLGLGFPKQELLAAHIRDALPGSWVLCCGGAISMAARHHGRAPRAMQLIGAEWLYRLSLEPRRLFRRYFINDLPFAMWLVASAVKQRVTSPVSRNGS